MLSHPLSQIGGILKQAMQAVIGLVIWFVIMEIIDAKFPPRKLPPRPPQRNALLHQHISFIKLNTNYVYDLKNDNNSHFLNRKIIRTDKIVPYYKWIANFPEKWKIPLIILL